MKLVYNAKGRGNLERALKNGAERGKWHKKGRGNLQKEIKSEEEEETGKGKRHGKIERKPSEMKGDTRRI